MFNTVNESCAVSRSSRLVSCVCSEGAVRKALLGRGRRLGCVFANFGNMSNGNQPHIERGSPHYVCRLVLPDSLWRFGATESRRRALSRRRTMNHRKSDTVLFTLFVCLLRLSQSDGTQAKNSLPANRRRATGSLIWQSSFTAIFIAKRAHETQRTVLSN